MIKPENNFNNIINEALRLYELFGTACLDNQEIEELLQAFRETVIKTDSAMIDTGVVEACSRCATKTGSCCFREMGESYSSLQLFLNLLLGSSLSERALFPASCRFVGDKGCRLYARHSFCLNYFCPDFKDFLGQEGIEKIQRQVGEQLLIGWELERALARWLADRCPEGAL